MSDKLDRELASAVKAENQSEIIKLMRKGATLKQVKSEDVSPEEYQNLVNHMKKSIVGDVRKGLLLIVFMSILGLVLLRTLLEGRVSEEEFGAILMTNIGLLVTYIVLTLMSQFAPFPVRW